ncbi:dTDP-4-dehydrorhamnose reductase family protein [Thalassotalea sp. ND16A]|uniref:dTDP-4-dehydrorhamnose reductase family protein n=1 Tax=Thalassotalea sp. ND16A TaxID=1535422 RepID=UPI00051A2911|nr:SDR family oxidoreductase [Thalassotalea sp. ND16A]KGJ94231.1 hypothetical protein ND16A_1437 [Thalassotalea sp. ND16A]
MKVLIIGATGMLGYSLFRNLSEYSALDVYGTVRATNDKESYFSKLESKLFKSIDVENLETLESVVKELKPNVVLNCIGLIKQYDSAKVPVAAIRTNSLLPHQIAAICDENSAKLIHFSTDCVFSGKKGNYVESDIPDASDIYGRSKLLGEVDYKPHLTLRTSIIGHELSSNVSLIDWFLSQAKETKGFSKAIFSGLPTCYVAKVLVDNIFTNTNLTGLYQLSVDPIDKFTLLSKVAKVYSKEITIHESDELEIDRSLDSSRLRTASNYSPLSWDELINLMHTDYLKYYK